MTVLSKGFRLSLLAALLLAGIRPPVAGAVELFLENRISISENKITSTAFNPDGTLLACGTENGEVALVPVTGGGSNVVFAGPRREVTVLAFAREGGRLAVAVKGKGVWLLDLTGGAATDPAAAGAAALPLEEAKGRIDVLAFSADGRYLAAGGDGKRITLWEIPSGQLRAQLKGHEQKVLAFAFLTGGQAVSIGQDKQLIIWDLAAQRALRQFTLEAGTMEGSGADLTAARVSQQSGFAAVAVKEHILQKGARRMLFAYHLAFFDLSKGVLLKILPDNNRQIDQLALYPGNCFVAFDNSTLKSHELALRNIESGSVELAYPLAAECTCLEFSPDGRCLAGVVDSPTGRGSQLNLWTVDYRIPASGCFMSRLRVTSTGGPVLGPGSSIGAGDRPRIAAVLPFGADQESRDLGLHRAAARFLETRLTGSPHLRLVERARIDAVLQELKFQQSGLVDRDTAVELGKLLGAGLIITGDLDRAGADLIVSARVVDAQTGEILGVKQVHCGQCGADDIFDAIELLAPQLVAD